MGHLFSYDNPVWSFIGKFGDALLLSVLWLICSLPIVTFGASTTALYYCCLKITRDEGSSVIKMFFHSFKQNLKQGCVLGLIMLVALLILGMDMWFWTGAGAEESMAKGMILLTLAMGWIYVLISSYVYAVLAQFSNTIKGIMAFSFAIAIRKLGWSILMVVVAVMVVYTGLRYFPPLLFFSPGVIAFFNSYILNLCFKQYLNPEKAE